MLIYFRPNVNKTSRHCGLAALGNPKQRNRWGWTGAACLTPLLFSPSLPLFPVFQDFHLQQHQERKPSLPEHAGTGGSAPFPPGEQPRTSVFILLGCSHRVSAEFLQHFPISSAPGKIGWVSSSSGFVLGRAAVLPLLGLRRGRWRELKGSSISSTHTAICYCEKPSVSRYYNPQRGNYS